MSAANANFVFQLSDENQSGATLSGKESAIIIAVFSTFFVLIFVLICCCICGCPCLNWRVRSRRRTTTANTSTSNTTSANVARVSSNATTTPFSSITITSNIVPAASSSSTSPRDDPKAIASTPSFVYKSAASEDKLECAVCLMKCKDGEKGRLLMGCGHSFHAECIDMWFQSHSTCPICRSTVENTRPELPV